ncbi:response regulator [Sandarakinorhabdus sp.]|uniref:response regulator n=1 Tax=Sandarakinorhabdus sp. TaxID=1916663 RepID=UPI00286E51B9|nr:response regulator [Sandarakinorhabdus sp.]
MLNNASILVVEDEPIIGMALAFAIEDAGGQVVGPVASIKSALALLETQGVAAAIMDVNLTDGVISPVVDYLMQRGVPLILQTGVGIPADLAARYPDLVVRIKPVVADVLVAELAALIVKGLMAEKSVPGY